MTDGSLLSKEPNLRYTKTRIISSPENVEAQTRDASKVKPEDVAELYRRNQGVIKKVDMLLEQIEKTSIRCIPVLDSAFEVRKALRVLYPDDSQDRICIRQYMECVRYKFNAHALDPVDLANTLTGNTQVDSRIINRMSRKSNDNLDWSDLTLIAGHFLLLFVANRIMQPHNSPNMQQIAATKVIYPGTEAVPATAQVLIGLAALLLQVAENKEEVKALIKDTVGELEQFNQWSADEIIAAAESKGTDDKVDKYQANEWPYYRELIVTYCEDFLADNADPDYSGWDPVPGLYDVKIDAMSREREHTFYGTTVEEALGTQWPMSLDIFQLNGYAVREDNRWLDKMAQVLSHKYTLESLCCFARYVGMKTPEQITLLRFSLGVAAEGLHLNYRNTLGSLSQRSNQLLNERILGPILNQLDRMIRKYCEKSLQMADPDNMPAEMHKVIVKCELIDELHALIIEAWERLGTFLKDLIRQAWRKLEVRVGSMGDTSLQIFASSRRARIMLSVVNQLIAASERGNLCAKEGGEGPTAAELEDFVNKVNGGMSVPIVLPTGGDPYETFNQVNFKTSLGFDMVSSVASPEELQQGHREFRIADCMRSQSGDAEVLRVLGVDAPLDRNLKNAAYFDDAGDGGKA